MILWKETPKRLMKLQLDAMHLLIHLFLWCESKDVFLSKYLEQCFSKVSQLAPQGGICKLKGGKIVKGRIGEECE